MHPTMNTTASCPKLEHFIQRLNGLLEQQLPEHQLLPNVRDLMGELVAQDNWLDPSFAVPHPQYYQQYLLHADPNDRFSVVSFVWGPGQSTPIHDHTVWGVIGMLRGAEDCQSYALDTHGLPQPVGPAERLTPGQTACVSPTIGDIHQVMNAHADQVSISIHVYGANIGKTHRHVFTPAGEVKSFVSGYANAG